MFHKQQREKNVIQRLVAVKGVLERIQDFHKDIDHKHVIGGGQAAPPKSTLDPAANALIKIDKLCMETKESQQLFTKGAKRLGELCKHLHHMEQMSALPKNDVVRIYTYVLERLYLFLKKQPTKA